MAPSSIKNLLTAFSPSGDYLAISAGDGRVKTWDTVSGCIRGDFADITTSFTGRDSAAGEVDGHLAVDYSCMTWNPAQRKGKKKPGKHGVSSLLGLGTGSGDVLLLDTALGQLKWRIKDCHSGEVKSLAFAKSGSIIYSAGADGMVCELDVNSGQLLEKFRASKRAVSCIAVSGDGSYLVAASAELRFFDLSSKKRLCKFTGHPDAVNALAYSDDDQHFISSSCGDRHVAVWQSDASTQGCSAACVLSMEHPAVLLHCTGGFFESLRVLAVSEAGVAYAWHASSMEELSKVQPVKISVAHAKGEASPASKSGKRSGSVVLAARFIGKSERGAGSVLVAYGTIVKPLFDRISLEGQGNHILLQTSQNGALLPALQNNVTVGKKGFQEAVTILGSDNAVDAIETRAHLEFDEATPTKPSSKKKRRASMDLIEGSQATDMDREKSSDVDEGKVGGVDENEETMEDKLKALGILEDGGTEDIDDRDAKAPPKADSLQILVTQALRADDNALLEQCLCVNDEKVIANTIQRLQALDAAKFLQLLVLRIDGRTRRVLSLVPWINAVLLHHASYLMSNPSMQPILSALYQVIDARLSVFRPLLSLSGRVDLIMAQISTNEACRQEGLEPVVVYEEIDDEVDGEVEDIMDVDIGEEGERDDSEDLDDGNEGLDSEDGFLGTKFEDKDEEDS